MVDLVKIRKKKAEKKAQESAPNAEQAAAAPVPAPAGQVKPAADDAVAPQTAAAQPTATPAVSPDAVFTSKLERFKQQAGKRRQTETVQKEQESESHLELLTFLIAGEQYAVDIERIVEIVTPRSVTRIPNADPSIVGIISLRGTIVTLVDVRRKLRHPAAGEATADTRVVVIDLGTETVGFVVDRVQRVVKTAPGSIEPHPVVHATELDDFVRGVFRAGGGALTILLDLDKLLDHGSLAVRTA